jgi:4-hydroxybenzoate polyprenyltransferase
MCYFILTSLYSLGLKRHILVDCLILAMLYTLRILGGAAVIHISLSLWLLAFSVFFFLSLAFMKRYAELALQTSSMKKQIHGRGYETTDAPLIQCMGITAGYASVLVLALYLNSEVVVALYRAPEFVWGAVPIILYWISWMWIQTHRGNMNDDPLVFAIKDKVSLLSGALFAIVLIIGATGWQW